MNDYEDAILARQEYLETLDFNGIPVEDEEISITCLGRVYTNFCVKECPYNKKGVCKA